MCEIWSSILKSQASLAKNKKARHGQLRFMEKRHNYRCVKSLLGKYKRQMSKGSFDMWNMKNI